MQCETVQSQNTSLLKYMLKNMRIGGDSKRSLYMYISHAFSMQLCMQESLCIHLLLASFHSCKLMLFILAEHTNAVERVGHFIGLIPVSKSFHSNFRQS